MLTLLAPTVKDKTLSLFQSTTSTQAYSGDSILIGDSEASLPFTTIDWKITQQPGFGDSYQTISIFSVPERVARRHLYRLKSDYNSPSFFTDLDSNTLPLRSYIYLLPKKYHGREQEPKAEFTVKFNYASSLTREPMIASVCPFDNRVQYSDYLDMEPGAVQNAQGCSRMLGDVENHCSREDQNCTNALRALTEITAPKKGSENAVFQSKVSSYYFFAALVPKNTFVTYEAKILMYFYKHKAFEKNYRICTIRGTDSCSFTTAGVLNKSWSWSKRHVIIAYIHPNSVPSSLTSRIIVEADVQELQVITLCLLCFTIAYLVIRHCFHSYLPDLSG